MINVNLYVMDIASKLKFSVRDFSAKRMGYLLDLVNLGFVPVHFFVSCQQSGGIAYFALLNTFAVLILCLFTPKIDPQRFMPFGLGIIICILHALSVH